MVALLTQVARSGALQLLTDDTELWDEPTVGLFINNVVPDAYTVIGDLTPCTEDGMEAQAGVEASAAFLDEDGVLVVELLTTPFVCGADPAEPVVVYGMYALGTVAAVLIGAERFEQPITIQREGDGVAYRLRLPFPAV